MKKMLAFLMATGMVVAAYALDNTVSNSFWCTWGYVNGTTNAQSGVSSVAVAKCRTDVAVSGSPAKFSTYPIGTAFTLR